MRSITLDGDTYDPSGQLSGGSRPNTGGVLLKVQSLKEMRGKLAEHTKLLKQIVDELDECHRIMGLYNGIKQKMELKEHEGKLLEERLAKNANTQVLQERVATMLDLKLMITVPIDHCSGGNSDETIRRTTGTYPGLSSSENGGYRTVQTHHR